MVLGLFQPKVNYLGGHPELVKQNVFGTLSFEEYAVAFHSNTLSGFGLGRKMFAIPYEKIISVTTNIEGDWSGMRLATGWLFLGPIGAMLFGKKKTAHIGILVQGKDSDGNPVDVPIAFSMAPGTFQTNEEVKTKILQHMAKIKKITI